MKLSAVLRHADIFSALLWLICSFKAMQTKWSIKGEVLVYCLLVIISLLFALLLTLSLFICLLCSFCHSATSLWDSSKLKSCQHRSSPNNVHKTSDNSSLSSAWCQYLTLNPNINNLSRDEEFLVSTRGHPSGRHILISFCSWYY